MAHLITFTTARFDVTAEPPNPINPIAGHGVLAWLRERLAAQGVSSAEPDAEDWGWYMHVRAGGSTYLVGASGEAEAPGEVEWIVQVHKERSLGDRLLARNRLEPTDGLSLLLEAIVRADDALRDVEVDRDG